MKTKHLLMLIGIFFLIDEVAHTVPARMPHAKQTIKILSLNLCQKHSIPREQRFSKVADFMTREQIDVLLLQEGSGGLWDLTCDSVADLTNMLRDRGSDYHFFTVNNVGISGFMVFKVGVMARMNPSWTDAACVGRPAKEWMDCFPLWERRNVAAIGADISELGLVSLVSVHFFSGGDKQKQSDDLIQFLNTMSEKHPVNVTVVGGDFNMGRNSQAYRTMINAGWIEITEKTGSSVDFIFVKGLCRLVSARLVLHVGEVSDHPGVMAEIGANTVDP